MSGFTLVSASSAEVAGNEVARLRAIACARGLSPVDLTAATWLVTEEPGSIDTLQVGAWTLVGRAHNRDRAPVKRVSDDDPYHYEKKLLARFWGAYVGVRFDGGGRPAAVLRDPSGALDCVIWSERGLTIITSHVPEWLLTAQQPTWSIAFDRVHQALHDPLSALEELLLDGPLSVLPGALQPLPAGDPVVLWRPDWIVRHGAQAPVDDEQAGRALVQAVDEAVSGVAATALAQDRALAAEVSGGLDSSLVASSLKAGGFHVDLWLNAFGRDTGSDERDHVAALARHLDITASCHARAEGVVTPEYLTSMPQGWRPPFSALDGLHDLDWANRLRAAGIATIVTGKGGDGLLIQPATGAVFADLWQDTRWHALFSPSLPALARWTERSVWSLLLEAWGRKPVDYSDRATSLVTPLAHAPPPHPWLRDITDLGPAKRMQIMGVIYGVGLHGPSLQTAVAEVRHPLLAQPVVEACLALPTWQLTLGRRDRGLARQAFTHRLPQAILERRSKGEMSAFYGRMIAGGLDVLRPWLLEGRLAAEGLIDRQAIETCLTPESLIWRGSYSDLMLIAGLEGWVRGWETRLRPAV